MILQHNPFTYILVKVDLMILFLRMFMLKHCLII